VVLDCLGRSFLSVLTACFAFETGDKVFGDEEGLVGSERMRGLVLQVIAMGKDLRSDPLLIYMREGDSFSRSPNYGRFWMVP
jgi:hypothetical protein